ncbi:phage portal protein [Neoehrlichia mikurensis]|uniref:Phage portal protein n=1 Tax=Neoehrlichia mikurensis TaxID=89586 RepID=A0A9Q9C0G1_9RICK|nr:phage portal protein [Neoehrlichia mikurensis]QXK92318.1 phage portal protein [Neoehrlichia mikurensis]QXK92772.1 phage portal protein [Neoehrlichia mikurensis]QXK94013.1 phage portal protein [Neoehrlichia mikurensis]UTO55824.1 phage portal protein [Neoehrlichia mikurensis]UTO56739.1 phage portal protein [Neoehrlichia mikurensis]
MKIFNFFNKTSPFSNISSTFSQLTNIWGDRNYTNFAENGYIKNVIAFRAIHMIASAVASVTLTLHKITKSGTFQIYNHPLLNLISRPNGTTSKSEFIEGIITYKLISGNAYILSVENNNMIPKELYLLRPDRVEIIPEKENTPFIYRYKVNNISHDFKVNKLNNFCNILHLKNFHPLNDWYGLSPIEAAAYSIDQHNQSGSWNQAMLQNGARPSGALIINTTKNSNGTLTQEQYQRLRSQVDEFYTGPTNSGRPILLEGGLEWKEMSLSPKDMDFIESKNSSARDIALAFGVPPQLLGIPGDNTYNNLAEARLALWEQTILPQLENILSHLNSWLIPQFKHSIFLSYDKDSISILTEKRQKLWQYVQNSTFMTINEKRSAFGLPPINNGNTL